MSRDVEVYTRRGEWVSVSVAGSEIRVVAGDGSGDGMAFLTVPQALEMIAALTAAVNEARWIAA